MAQEVDEHAAGRSVRVGVMIGIPVVLVVLAAGGLLAGAGLSASLQLAGWPALVAGPYLGGLFSLLYAQGRVEHVAEVHELRRPAERPAAERRAA